MLLPKSNLLLYSLDQSEFQIVDVSNGLSQNSVSSLFQDYIGFIWIGTADGLNRYDGNKVKVFRNDENSQTSIEDNFINTIFSGGTKGFWIGHDGGFSFYNYQTGSFDNVFKDRKSRYVKGISIDDNKILWRKETRGISQLIIYDKSINDFKEIDHKLISDYLNDVRIKKDILGRVWVITQKSAYLLNIKNLTLQNINFPIPLTENIVDLEFLGNGLGYLATNNSLYKLNNDNSISEKLSYGENIFGLKSIFLDSNNTVWFADASFNGLISYNVNYKQFKRYFIENNNNISLRNFKVSIIDASGVIWIGSDGGGVVRYNPNGKKFNLIPPFKDKDESLTVNFTKGMIIDRDKNLWVSTIKGGLNKYSLNTKSWENYSPNAKGKYRVSSISGMSVFQDSRGTIWFGGSTSIDTFDTKKNKFVKAFDEFANQAIFEDSYENIWIGNLKNLISKYSLKSKNIEILSDMIDNFEIIDAERVYSVAETKDKMIWLGTDKGLYRIDLQKRIAKNYQFKPQDTNSLSHNYALVILNDSKENLWIGTRDGLNLYNSEKDNFTRFKTQSGLSNSFIYGILEDLNGNYWLSTNNGLTKMTFESTKKYSFRNYKINDGLQSNEFNTNSFTKSDDGFLFFGGLGGINYFHPDSVVDNKFIPNIVISNIHLFDKEYVTSVNTPLLKKIELSYFDNTLAFEFAALEYSSPTDNVYAYKLEGVDNDWVYCGNSRYARYVGLKPGKYVFRLKGSNDDENWNEEGASLEVIINAPFWKKTEFIVLSTVLAISLIIFAFRFRTRKIRQRNSSLIKAINESTEQLKSKNEKLSAQAEEIFKINQSLEKRVEERTEELQNANKKLYDLLNEISDSKNESLQAIIKTQEDERSRFAKDLHDGAGQFLSFLKFNLNNILNKISDENIEIRNNLSEQIKLTDNIVAELRRFAYSLMPPVLERIGLNAALEELIDIYKSTTKIKFEYYFQENKKLPKYSKIQLYRIIQEVMNNAIKHSQCSRISLQVLAYPNNLLIIIEDNGKGFNPETIKPGMGLKNIQSRILLINGKIDIDSQVNHGTTITLEVPS